MALETKKHNQISFVLVKISRLSESKLDATVYSLLTAIDLKRYINDNKLMKNQLSFGRKLEIYFYILFTLIGVYFTLKQIEFNIVRAVLDHRLPKVGASDIDLGITSWLLMIGNGIAFLIFSIKRQS